MAIVESPPGAERQLEELSRLVMVKDMPSSSSAMKGRSRLSRLLVVRSSVALSYQGPLTAVSAFQSDWRRGVGFPLGPLNHGRLLDGSAGLYELYGAFRVPRTMPAHTHVLTYIGLL